MIANAMWNTDKEVRNVDTERGNILVPISSSRAIPLKKNRWEGDTVVHK
jgi:hypothetical protein